MLDCREVLKRTARLSPSKIPSSRWLTRFLRRYARNRAANFRLAPALMGICFFPFRQPGPNAAILSNLVNRYLQSQPSFNFVFGQTRVNGVRTSRSSACSPSRTRRRRPDIISDKNRLGSDF